MKRICIIFICFLLLVSLLGCNSIYSSEDLFEQGMQYWRANKYSEALLKFEAAEKKAQKYSEEYMKAVYYEAITALELKQYQKVVKVLEQYKFNFDESVHPPELIQSQLVLTKGYIGLKDYEKAKKYLSDKRISSIFEKNSDYWSLLADIARGQGDKQTGDKYAYKAGEIYVSSTEPNIITISKEPQIGMTAEEVRNSSWGSPKDINRTTTANGVDEQWVYSGYRYVYLEDGIVTAIQD